MRILYIITVMLFVSAAMYGQAKEDSTRASGDSLKYPPVHGRHFIDRDGDGYNDNAPDHDNDGIPNGLDKDYRRMQMGKMRGHMRGHGMRWRRADDSSGMMGRHRYRWGGNFPDSTASDTTKIPER